MDHLHKTEAYFAEHGGKTVIFARFVPIVRTFAPFVAGMGAMVYRRFLSFSIFGTLCWVSLFVGLGYFFGNLPFVQKNFSAVILGIIVVSILPAVFEFWRESRRGAAARRGGK